jgi:hypothetical protein
MLRENALLYTVLVARQKSSVADPDPNPDPLVFGLLDPDLLVRGMDPDPDPALDPNPSIIMQK